MKNIQRCRVASSVIRMKYFAPEKLGTKSFGSPRVFPPPTISKCRNSPRRLDLRIGWREIFFFDPASLQAPQNGRNLDPLIFIPDRGSSDSRIMSPALR